MKAALTLILLACSLLGFSQEKISFYSSDSLRLTADLYLTDYQKPFVLLFHQLESSRGEYQEIAPRLQKLGYNCLAVDLRSGSKINYVKNETAYRARKEKPMARSFDDLMDINASIEYIKQYNDEPVILFGSSYSASLVLVSAKNNDNILAVIAFSPGEYFLPTFNIKDEIKGLNLPYFACSTELEYEYSKKLLENIESPLKLNMKPSAGRGVHGAKALWSESECSKECWLQLAYFFNKLKEL